MCLERRKYVLLARIEINNKNMNRKYIKNDVENENDNNNIILTITKKGFIFDRSLY